MNLSITARGYKAPERLKQYISEKIDRKKRMYEGVIDTELVLSYEKLTQVAELKVKIFNKILVAREKSDDIFKSIDLALNNIDRKIKRHKEKSRDHKNRKIREKLVIE